MKLDVVFEGGGAKGLAHVGAMESFFASGHTLGRSVGTSAGAMTAGLLAAGFSADELQAAALERLPDGRPVFSSFMDVPQGFPAGVVSRSWLVEALRSVDIPMIPNWAEHWAEDQMISLLLESPHFREVFSFVELGGLYAGDALQEWLRGKLNMKDGLGECNLSELHQRTGSELTVVASDTTGEQMLVLNHRTAPRCPAPWAIRMSMGIPFVYQEVLWKSDWGDYDGKSIDGHAIVDGGVVSNFALELLVSASPEVREVMGDSTGDGVVGFMIDENLEVPDAPPRPREDEGSGESARVLRSRVVGRIGRLVDTMTDARDRFVVAGFEKDVCRLPAKGYGTTEFDMSPERIDALVKGGSDAAQSFFESLDAT